MTILGIVFDDTIPISVNYRDSRFMAEDGWSIVEESPGRVSLSHPEYAKAAVISQGLPYTIWTSLDEIQRVEPAVEQPKGKRGR